MGTIHRRRKKPMDENNSIQLFEDRKIRTAWDEEKEEWYFSVVDVVAVLSDSANPTDYLKKMRKRDEQLASYLGTNCPQVEMTGSTGKKRKVLAANTEQILRIIQSIPSPKAEPFRRGGSGQAQRGREISKKRSGDAANGYTEGRVPAFAMGAYRKVSKTSVFFAAGARRKARMGNHKGMV